MVLDSGIFVVIAAVALSTIMTEVVLYLWVYRTPSFRAVRDQLELFQQSQDSLAAGPKLRNKGRKAEREEDRLKREVTKEMSKLRLKQAVVLVGAMTCLFRGLLPVYNGVPVARLPFEPFKLLQRLTHLGLEGPITDCSMTFVFTLSQAAVRPSVTMLLGLGPSRKMQEMMQPAALSQAMNDKDA